MVFSDDSIPQAFLLLIIFVTFSTFDGIFFGVDSDFHFRIFAAAPNLEWQFAHFIIAGGQNQVGLEEFNMSVLNVEDKPIPQSSSWCAEDKPDIALIRLFFWQFIYSDACSLILGSHKCFNDGDVAALSYLDLCRQVRSLYLFALGRNLLDACPHNFRHIAKHQAAAEFLVENHLEGAGLLGFLILAVVRFGDDFLVLLAVFRIDGVGFVLPAVLILVGVAFITILFLVFFTTVFQHFIGNYGGSGYGHGDYPRRQ